MIIDIEPKIRVANETEKIILEMREIPALYVVLTSDGKEHTVQFDPKRLDEFLPSRTVSETLKNWQENIIETIAEYKKAVETNIHPWWTATKKTMIHYPQFAGHPELEYRWNGKYHEAPLEMTKSQSRFFQSEIKRMEAISGEMTFVKITHMVNSKGEEINAQGYTLKSFTRAINEEMENSGLPVSAYKKKYFYTKWKPEEVLNKGWFHGIRTPKEIVKGIEKNFEEIWN